MIPKICDLCKQVRTEKPVSLYWAWNLADGHRKAYRQKVCLDCAKHHYASLIRAALEPILICPACGIATVDDYDAVYLTYCVPGHEKQQSEMPFCGPCAVGVRVKAMEGATLLDDRGVGVGGLSPQPSDLTSTALWDQLGLTPSRRNG